MHDSAGGHLADADRHHTDRAGVARRAALLEGPVCGLVIQCDLGLAGGRLSRCAGRPWHRGVDLGAAARSWLHPPHTRDNPGFGDRSFYALVVDRAGPFGDLRARAPARATVPITSWNSVSRRTRDARRLPPFRLTPASCLDTRIPEMVSCQESLDTGEAGVADRAAYRL